MSICFHCKKEIGKDAIFIGGFEFCGECWKTNKHKKYMQLVGMIK